MPFRLSFLTDPFPWIVLASIFLGAAVSRITRRTATARDPDRARTRKWVLFCIWLSLAIALTAGALLVTGVERFLDARLAYAAIAGFLLSFLTSRFRRSIGIPVVVLLIVTVVALGLFFQSLRAFTGETEIAQVNVVSADAGRMRLELVPHGRPAALFDLEGDYFAPVVKVVIFNDLWVFLGARTWYRFVGIAPFVMKGEMPEAGGSPWVLPQPAGISATLWSAFERAEGSIPGVKAVQTEVTLKKARALRSYSVRVQNDGGVEVVPLSD